MIRCCARALNYISAIGQQVLDVVRTTTRVLRAADREVRRQVLGKVEQALLMQGHQTSLCNSKGSDAAGLLSFRHSFVRVDDGTLRSSVLLLLGALLKCASVRSGP
jgi:hypothetical protein